MLDSKSNSGGVLKLVKRSKKPSSPFFRAGDEVPFTGLYRLSHREDRVSDEVILLKERTFPRCFLCGYDVRFELVAELPIFDNHPDFRDRQIFELPHPQMKSKAAKRSA